MILKKTGNQLLNLLFGTPILLTSTIATVANPCHQDKTNRAEFPISILFHHHAGTTTNHPAVEDTTFPLRVILSGGGTTILQVVGDLRKGTILLVKGTTTTRTIEAN